MSDVLEGKTEDAPGNEKSWNLQLPTTEHLEAHKSDFDDDVELQKVMEKVSAAVRSFLQTVDKDKGRISLLVSPDRSFGRARLVGTDENTEVVWGYRKGRKIPTRFVKSKELESSYGVAAIGFFDKEQNKAIIRTIFPSSMSAPLNTKETYLPTSDPQVSSWNAPSEVFSKQGRKSIRSGDQDIVDFWRKHALAVKQEEIDSGNITLLDEVDSSRLEEALQKQPSDLLDFKKRE